MRLFQRVTGAAAALAFGVLASASAHAAVLDWTLHDVVFDDGGTVTGDFFVDTISGAVTDWDITTTSGGTLPGYHYASSASQIVQDFWAPNSFMLQTADYATYLQLAFLNPLTAGGVSHLSLGPPTYLGPSNQTQSGSNYSGSWECNDCYPLRSTVSGFASTGGVPEPATWALMLTGFAGLGIALRTHRRVATLAG